jgi:K+-transporting ATPase A subunit
MKKNMGGADRLIRFLIVILIGFLYFTGRIGGVLAIILGVVAVAFLLTSLVGRCPGYVPLKLSTRRKHTDSSGA